MSDPTGAGAGATEAPTPAPARPSVRFRLGASWPATVSYLFLAVIVVAALVGPLLVMADPLRQSSAALLP
ncbi:hypothetical protein NGM37_49905, partial [Streptomyces sp. TRM76130]|nr:hypothetical protein [Streptomyces sp. TRM76130]